MSEFLRDLRQAHRMAKKNNLSILAGSVAFFCLFSLMPFLILCFLASRYVLAHNGVPQGGRELSALFEALMPAGEPWFSDGLVTILKRNKVSNVFSLALLCWTTYELFSCLTNVFAHISLHGRRERHPVLANIVAVICFLIVGASSTLFLFLFTTRAEFLRALFGQYLNTWDLRAINLLASALAMLCVVGSITFIYKIMPTQRVSMKHALRGSLLFLTLFLFGRAFYQVYVMYFRAMNENIYGGFFSFMVIVVWIYYLSNIFLFSAQYALYLEQKK